MQLRTDTPDAARVIGAGEASLGLELGSSTIKACLVGPHAGILATASEAWENAYVDGLWTYSLDAVWAGVQRCMSRLLDEVVEKYGVPLNRLGAMCVSAMMHGYIALDSDGELLAPFRTWRNTNAAQAAAELSLGLEFNIPSRWSAAHLYQAAIDHEPHVADVARITTLAGYVHHALTGNHVLGVGDASGVFPIDGSTGTYDEHRLHQFGRLLEVHAPGLDITSALPRVLTAGSLAGHLTEAGARLLDPSNTLEPGVPFAPPEGDAGTGMVATNSIAPRTANISAGTSIFAMVVLDRLLERVHTEVDIVATPVGAPVAMVHCNNGASELQAWVKIFREFAVAAGTPVSEAIAFEACLRSASEGEPDTDGLVAYNYLAGEPITGLTDGRPLVARTPSSRFTLANFMRAQVYSVFGTLTLGMKTLAAEGVEIDRILAHGGLFKTAGVGQRFLSAALDSPVSVRPTAGAGGAWGAAVLADYLRSGANITLVDFLQHHVFDDTEVETVHPDSSDVAGFASFLQRYETGLTIERAAVRGLA